MEPTELVSLRYTVDDFGYVCIKLTTLTYNDSELEHAQLKQDA